MSEDDEEEEEDMQSEEDEIDEEKQEAREEDDEEESEDSDSEWQPKYVESVSNIDLQYKIFHKILVIIIPKQRQ